MGEIRVKTADGWNTFPSHQKTADGWKDIPTHIMTANGWQGELTSQSPLEFRATGQSLLDWRIDGKTSGNLCERFTSVGTAEQYSASLYMFADIQPSTIYTIAFEIDEGSLQYFNENLFTYSQYYVTGTGNKQILQINAKANIQKTAATWSDTYGWIIANNYPGNATVPHWKKLQLLKGIYTSSTIPPYEPYGGVGDWDETEQQYKIPVNVRGKNLLNSDKQTQGDGFLNNTACVLYNNKITFTVTGAFWITEYIKIKPNTLYYYYQNLLRSSSACMTFYDENKTQLSGHVLQTAVLTESTTYTLSAFRTPQNAVYMRMNIDSNSSVNCLYSDEVASYEPYINTTTNLFTDHQLMDGDSLDYTTDQTSIPITQGDNTLTVGTAVQPKSVFVKFEG